MLLTSQVVRGVCKRAVEVEKQIPESHPNDSEGK